ncbi:CASP-like protein 1E1 [Chenopodium quinoa]|uniref:CASP-like protein 1E1 n=1 Tax=Chenopodium quinoa TaxID=63459 RepID=UPI000B7871EC|nr:CASP-like protein 1E1 [Chenopodium quinoa]
MANNNIEGLDGIQRNKEKGHGIRVPELILRVLALILTLIAAILLGVNKQTKIVPIKISPDLPAFNVPVSAKSSYASAFVYSVVANSIACALAAISIGLTFISMKGGRGFMRLIIIIVDLILVALLFSSIGAAGAVGLLGYNGNSHLRWNKVCNVYGKFCHQVMASLALSLLGAISFLLLVTLAISKLHKNA